MRERSETRNWSFLSWHERVIYLCAVFWNGVVRYAGPVTDHRGAELCHPLIRRHVGPRLRTLGLKQGTRARVPSTRQHSPLPGLACLPF